MTTLVRPRRLDDASLRLAVFHHAGGSATAYVPLARALPASWDTVLIDLPGRGPRQAAPPPWDLAATVEQLAQDLLPEADAAPLALFGHSLGAVLAFETAHALDARGVPVAWLGVSGRAAPGEQPAVPWLGPRAPDEDLASALRRLGGLPARLDEYPVIRRRFLDLTRIDLRALDDYRPDLRRRPLAAPLTAFGGTADPLTPPAALTAWARQTTGPFGVRALRGGHFSLFDDGFRRFAPMLVDEIRAHVRERAVVLPYPSGARERI
ncbi:thioesterase II family protein [Actinoplanes sp. NPDC049599]|uniref:thioesterase II family protein n=1 Tax=Actinoplanes sp. NPDC049599 TaxID=3363903 RepID=UPI003798CFA4